MGIDHTCLLQGNQREQGRGGITAGVGQQSGSLDGRALDLGESIDGLRQMPGKSVFESVPVRVESGIPQPKSPAQINQTQPPLEEFGHQVVSGLVRGGQKYQRDLTLPEKIVVEGLDLQVAPMAELSQLVTVELDPGSLAVGSHQGGQLHLRMGQQQSDDLRAGVSTGSNDGNLWG